MQMISSLLLPGTFFHIFNGLMPFAVFKPTFLLLEAEDFGFLLPTDFPFVLLVNPSLERIVLSLETIFRSVLSTLMLMLAVVPKSISIPFFCIKLYIIGWCWYRVKDAKFCCFKDFFSEYKYAEGCDPSPIPSNFTTSIQKLMEVFYLSLSSDPTEWSIAGKLPGRPVQQRKMSEKMTSPFCCINWFWHLFHPWLTSIELFAWPSLLICVVVVQLEKASISAGRQSQYCWASASSF